MSEKKVRNPDLLIIILIRYFLEMATKLSLEKIQKANQSKEFCELMLSAASGNITNEQIEYILMFYATRPEELIKDFERMIGAIRNMVDKGLKGV